jgi:hypothetical protein
MFNINIGDIPKPFLIRCFVLWFYRNNQSQNYIGDDTGAGEKYRYHGYHPDNRGVDIEILGETAAYAGDFPVGLTSIKPLGHRNILLYEG